MVTKKILFIFITIALVFTIRPNLTKAVSISTVGGNVMATLSPSEPGPNQSVTVKLTAPGDSLNQAKVTWKLNGALVNNNNNQTSFTFTTGQLGSMTHLEINITLEEPAKKIPTTARVTILIPVGDLDLLWETDTSVPTLYKGKALSNNVTSVKVVAIPNIRDEQGKLITNDLLEFTWRKDGRNITSASGVGKNILIFNPNYSPDNNISATVKPVASVRLPVTATKTIVIEPSKPKLVLYKEDPLQGSLFNTIIKSLNLIDDEISLRAEPFFLGGENRRSGTINYDWRLNGKSFPPASGTGNIVVLRKPDNQTGNSNITISATDNAGAASNNFVVSYGLGSGL